ncbi:MAG TPA: hypothetical protein EYP10_06305 [Armatimonadetes bacterium]|nr:hypothetical protein [Armatimonadota bacterium]
MMTLRQMLCVVICAVSLLIACVDDVSTDNSPMLDPPFTRWASFALPRPRMIGLGEYLLEQLKLSPEQRKRVRELMREYARLCAQIYTRYRGKALRRRDDIYTAFWRQAEKVLDAKSLNRMQAICAGKIITRGRIKWVLSQLPLTQHKRRIIAHIANQWLQESNGEATNITSLMRRVSPFLSGILLSNFKQLLTQRAFIITTGDISSLPIPLRERVRLQRELLRYREVGSPDITRASLFDAQWRLLEQIASILTPEQLKILESLCSIKIKPRVGDQRQSNKAASREPKIQSHDEKSDDEEQKREHTTMREENDEPS